MVFNCSFFGKNLVIVCECDKMKILDATCGAKGMWYQKNYPLVTWMDKRNGKYYYATENNPKKCIDVNPDVVSEWKDALFPDNYFDMIIFDPPHIIRKTANSKMILQYGKLRTETWKYDLKEGIDKLFKILKSEGVFILKWAESGGGKIEDVLKLFPYPPLFGTRTGANSDNHWIVFLKYDVNNK